MSISSWSPLTLTQAPYAVILLNQPIKLTNFHKLWNEASFRICVDGGTNQLYELSETNLNPSLKAPDLITGDFDSIQESVKQFYAEQGSAIVHTLDQDYTDFSKALIEVRRGDLGGEYPKVESILAVIEPSGRYDHFFANVNTLLRTRDDLHVFLLSEESITWVLRAGDHRIQLEADYVDSHPHCGIIPMTGKTVITSKGLKWNLDSTECYFEGMVSTSNEIVGTSVEISTSGDVLWTMMRTRSL